MKLRKILFISLIVFTSLMASLCIVACNASTNNDDESNADNTGNTNNSIVTYTVSYARGSDEATGDVPQVEKYAVGDKVTIAGASTFLLDGYTFDKWSDGTTEYYAKSEFTMPAHNVTFTAIWKLNSEEPDNPPIENEDIPTIAVICSSIAESTGNYTAQLQNLLGNKYNVVDFCNNGKTVTGDPKDGEPWLKQEQWKEVQVIKPDIAVIDIGINDSKPVNFTDKATFKSEYANLINSIKELNPLMDIYICTTPYAYSNSYSISNDNICDAIAPAQREVAQESNYHLVDLYEFSQNKSLIFCDGVYSDTMAHKMFSEILSKIITEGDSAVTENYIASMNAKYNDKVYDYSAEINVDNDKINLSVYGNTVLSENAEIKVRLIIDAEKYFDYNAEISDGQFSTTIDLAKLENACYSVCVYVYDEIYYPARDNFRHLILMTESQYSAGNKFNTLEKQVMLDSWQSGWGLSFSIVIGDYKYVNIESSVISKIDGNQTLSLSGTTNAGGLCLYVGDPMQEVGYSEYEDITVEDGRFTTSFNLNSMPVGGRYDVRIYLIDGSYFVVPLSETTDGTTVLKSGDVIYGDTTKIKIVACVDGGVEALSFNVEEYDSSYSVTADNISFENGKLKVTGTVRNVQTLYMYLINADVPETLNNYAEAEIAQDGTFTVFFALSQTTAIQGAIGLPLNLGYKVNDIELDVLTMLQSDIDLSQKHNFGSYSFVLGLSEGAVCVRFSNREYNYKITSANISEIDGKAMLNLCGIVDSDVKADNIKLLLDKTVNGEHQISIANALTEDGKFAFSYYISQLKCSSKNMHTEEEGYFLKLLINDVTVEINCESLKDQLFKKSKIDGDIYYFYCDSLTEYNTLGIVRLDGTEFVPSIRAKSVKFSNGNLVFTGEAENVITIYVYLINTNITESLNNYVEAEIAQDGTFTAILSLDVLIDFVTSDSINLRYKIDDLSDSITDVWQGDMDISQVYAYNGKTFKFGINPYGCVAVSYKTSVNEIVATYVGFEDGFLIVRATAIYSFETLDFYIQNTAVMHQFEYLHKVGTVEEGGAFEVKIALDDLSSAPCDAYLNFRVSLDGSKDLIEITEGDNKCDLTATVEYNSNGYVFSKNGTTICIIIK